MAVAASVAKCLTLSDDVGRDSCGTCVLVALHVLQWKCKRGRGEGTVTSYCLLTMQLRDLKKTFGLQFCWVAQESTAAGSIWDCFVSGTEKKACNGVNFEFATRCFCACIPFYFKEISGRQFQIS
jgi:hypothetical protein